MRKNWIIKAIILPMVIVLDMITKFLFEGKSYTLIPKVLGITSLHNYGAAWGVFSGRTWLLIALTVVFVILIVAFDIWQKIDSKLYSVGISFIVGGAVGNIIDRIAYGYVRDFIEFRFINFPIFNLADSFLTIGVILIIIKVLFFSRRKEGAVR